jgi:hypothetical protein
MGTPLPGPYAFNTRQYFDPSGDTGAPIDVELSWEQLDTTLLFLSGAIAGVPIGIAEVLVGPSASGAPNNLIGSSSGNVTGSIQEGTVWVVAGDTNPNANGLSYIFDRGIPTPGYGIWYPLELNIPLPFVRIFSASRQDITSSLLISGSEVTFSSSLYWSGSSQAAANSTNYTVILSSSGQLYVTGAYGSGGGGGGVEPLGFKTNTNATYQLLTTDVNKVVRLNNASTITVGVTASLFSSGSQIIVFQSGAGQINFSPSTTPATNMYSANNMRKTRTQYSAATLIFSGSDCYLFGDIAP